MIPSASLKKPALTIAIPATIATLLATVLFPFLIHALPLSVAAPIGAILVPMFYAPLLALFLFHPVVGLVAALLDPWLNYVLLGQPAVAIVPVLTFELLVFSLVTLLLLRQWPKLWLAAPLAFLLCKFAAGLLLSVVPLLPAPPWTYALSSLQAAWPGVIVLLLLNAVMVVLLAKKTT